MIVTHRFLEPQKAQKDADLVGQFFLPGRAQATGQLQAHAHGLLGRQFLVLGLDRQEQDRSHALVLQEIEYLVRGHQSFEPILARIFPVRFWMLIQGRNELEIQRL